MPEQNVAVSRGATLARAEDFEAMYRSLVEALPAITYTEAVEDRRALSVSPQIKRLLGYSQDEWLGNSLLWEELVHPEDRDRVVEACDIANRKGEPFSAEFRMVAKDGRVVWIRDEATLVLGSKGQPLCWQGVMLDISSERQAQEAFDSQLPAHPLGAPNQKSSASLGLRHEDSCWCMPRA